MNVFQQLTAGFRKRQQERRIVQDRHRWAMYTDAVMHGLKQAPFLWPSWRTGQPQWQMFDFASYAQEGFNLNSLIYSAIMYKARALTCAALRVYTGDRDNPELADEQLPLCQLVSRPNAHQSQIEFAQQLVVYLNIAGNAFVYLERVGRNEIPRAMYALRPDRVFIVPDRQMGIQSYVYVPEGKTAREGTPILPRDMMHVKLPNPLDPMEGMGQGLPPISALARNADVDNAVTLFLKQMFDRGLMPNVLIQFKSPLDDEIVGQAKERFREAYGGSREGWLDPMILGDEGSVQNLGFKFNELGFDGIDERNETRILGPFGVPPILIGARSGLKTATYSNYEQARRAFWQDTFVPELRMFEVEWQYYLNQPDAGLWVGYDLSEVPALWDDIGEQATAYAAFVASGMPPVVAAEMCGLPMPQWPGSEVGRIPLTLVPISAPVTTPVGDVSQEPSATEETRKSLKARRLGLTPEQKHILWKQIDATSTQWERAYTQGGREAFEIDRRNVLAILSGAKSKAYRQKAIVNIEQLAIDWDEYFKNEAPDNWREVFMPLVRATITDTATMLNAEFGMQFDVQNLFAQEWYQQYELQFAGDILVDTSDELKTLLLQAQQNGWTTDEIRKQVEMTFKRYVELGYDPTTQRGLTEEEIAWFTERLPKYRLENIARTETLKASNAGSFALYESWGVVELKEWLSTNDDRTRASHIAAGMQYGEGGNPGPIPMRDPFIVGGEQMMYPLDGSLGASPANICQCRCTVAPVIMEVQP